MRVFSKPTRDDCGLTFTFQATPPPFFCFSAANLNRSFPRKFVLRSGLPASPRSPQGDDQNFTHLLRTQTILETHEKFSRLFLIYKDSFDTNIAIYMRLRHTFHANSPSTQAVLRPCRKPRLSFRKFQQSLLQALDVQHPC